MLLEGETVGDADIAIVGDVVGSTTLTRMASAMTVADDPVRTPIRTVEDGDRSNVPTNRQEGGVRVISTVTLVKVSKPSKIDMGTRVSLLDDPRKNISS